MTEQSAEYRAQAERLKAGHNHGMMPLTHTEVDTVRVHLADLERQLISLLVTVQRAQGKEPTVNTREAKRRR